MGPAPCVTFRLVIPAPPPSGTALFKGALPRPLGTGPDSLFGGITMRHLRHCHAREMQGKDKAHRSATHVNREQNGSPHTADHQLRKEPPLKGPQERTCAPAKSPRYEILEGPP